MAHVDASPISSAPTFLSTKQVTFTGASGLGQSGTTTTWFTVAGGLVVIDEISGRVVTNCTGASSTQSLGVVGQVALFIAATVMTTLVTTAAIWMSTTPTAGGLLKPAITQGTVINANIISTVAVADTTGGVIEINVRWHPLTPGATLT